MEVFSVSIRNLRSIQDVTLPDCGRFNVLIGKNNSGKSTVLSAIQEFFRTATDGLVSTHPAFGRDIDYHYRRTDTPIEISARLVMSDEESHEILSDIVSEAPQVKNAVEATSTPFVLSASVVILKQPVRFSYFRRIAIHPDLSDSGPGTLLVDITPESAEELRSRVASSRQRLAEATSLTRALSDPTWLRAAVENRPSSERIPTRYYIERGLAGPASRELLNAVEEITAHADTAEEARRELRRLIDQIKQEAASAQNMPLQRRIETFAGDVSSLPDYVHNVVRRVATMRVVHLSERREPIGRSEASQILSLKTRRGGAASLRNIQNTVQALLGVQVDAYESEAQETSQAQIKQLDIETAQAVLPQELGIRLSSVLMFERLVFVEATSDEAVLRDFGATLGVNFGQANLGFVHTGGARGLAQLNRSDALDYLGKRGVHLFFMIDRDESSDKEAGSLTRVLGNLGRVHVLRRREIENYLASPAALAKFIGMKRELGGSPGPAPTIEQVSESITAVRHELRDLALAKRVSHRLCRPIYPARRRSLQGINKEAIHAAVDEDLRGMIDQLEQSQQSVERVIDEEAQLLETSWETNSVQLVPGDELLDGVCQRFGVRYRKERDASWLASLVPESDIDEELRMLIQDLVS